MKPKIYRGIYTDYLIEPYDAEGYPKCKSCGKLRHSTESYDVSSYDTRTKTFKFTYTICKKCKDNFISTMDDVTNLYARIYPEPLLKSVPEPTCLTYNDIINALSHMIEVEQDESDELAALNMLEDEIQKLINRLKSESPLQTPAEP